MSQRTRWPRALRRMGVAVTGALFGALAGCGPNAGDNPPQLWLALGSDELHARLAAVQPPHF